MYYGIVFSPWTIQGNNQILEVNIDHPPGDEVVVDTNGSAAEGFAQSSTTNTIELEPSDNYGDGFYNGMVIDIVAGAGAVQRKNILSFVGGVITVDSNWSSSLDNTSQYIIYPKYTLYGSYANATPLSQTAWGNLLGTVNFSAAKFQVSNSNFPALFNNTKYCVLYSTQDEMQLNALKEQGPSGQEVNKLRTWLLAQGLTNQEINQIDDSSTSRKDFMDAITNYLNTVAEA